MGKNSDLNSNKHLSCATTCNPTTLVVEIIPEFNPVVIYVEVQLKRKCVVCWTWWTLNPANTLTSKKPKQHTYKCISHWSSLIELPRSVEREGQRTRWKITLEVILNSLRKIHKMESHDMTSWWSLSNGSPASHNWNNAAGCQKSRRHIMHNSATNVWGSIDRENGSLMTEMEHFIRKPESSLYGWLLLHCNTPWWKTGC